ncbi:hypothetical protein ACIBCA_31360 [Kitasatospora sp. NPDC051170]|uniref:hypothetical protein n=1 Tax=Kitasatospora sp. NPDC051170 TaxID=3364056 RepID=UPI0037B4EA1C
MDPITAATLTAIAGGVAGEVGRQAWQGLAALVRRPFRRGGGEEQQELPGVSSGEVELAALEAAPTDPGRAQALATVLGVRAALDPEFGVLLDEWRTQAEADSAGSVHNTISGGTQNGPVVQGRDFSNLTFNMPGTLRGDDRG